MLTADHIAAMLRAAKASTTGKVASLQQIADLFNDAITTYAPGEYDTAEKVAALVSECMMESDYFRALEEYRKTGPYAPFIGRSFIQITHDYNYRAFGAWCAQRGLVDDPDYFYDNPKRLADLRWAAVGGVWYFEARGILAFADDIERVGRTVNGGTNGMAARISAYKAVLSLGSQIIPSTTTAPEAPVKYAPRHGKALADYARSLVGTKYGQGWCQKFVNETAQTGPVGDYDGDRAADAEDGWKKAKAKGKVVLNDADFRYDEIPPGVFHYWTGGSADHGHAALGVGGRRIVGTDLTDDGPRYGRIGECDITQPRISWGVQYVGYAIVEGNGYTLVDPPETTPKPSPSKDTDAPTPAKPKVSLRAVVAAFEQDSKRAQGGTTPGSADDVKIVEAALVAEGLLDKKYASDGSAGSLTVKAYAALQRRRGAVGKGADGIPGKTTLTWLGEKHGFEVVA